MKLRRLSFIFIVCFIFMSGISAKEFKYKYEDTTFKFNVTKEGVKLTNPNNEESTVGGQGYPKYSYDYSWFNDYIKSVKSTDPFAIYICEDTFRDSTPGGGSVGHTKYYFFLNEMEKEKYEESYYLEYNFYPFTNETCEYSKEYNSGVNRKICTTFNIFFVELDEKIEKIKKEYKDNISEKQIEIEKQFNSSMEEIKQSCNVILQYSNYDSACVKPCLGLNKKITTLKKDYGIKDEIDFEECGLSGRMVAWLKNILKWIKYILPVFVIILGILDFIKAISSGSDDEMKKAQGKFIKRLIAAALLFLIPALIEFILEVFKIESTFCGIV